MRFFFYGTLLAGSDNPVAKAIHEKLEPEGPATVCGSLYAIPDTEGWFPALVPGGDEIRGAIYRAGDRFGADDLAQMDRYEDCGPLSDPSSLYRRAEMAAVAKDGSSVRVQVYLFNQPLPKGELPIVSGDFREWLKKAGLPAFGGLRAS